MTLGSEIAKVLQLGGPANGCGVDDGRSAVQADFDFGGIAVYNNPRRSVADPTLTEATHG